MLDIWVPQSKEAVEEFCRVHKDSTGEVFTPARVSLYVSRKCPYTNYDWIRVELGSQIVSRGAGTTTISSRAVSYYLRAKGGTPAKHSAIPLFRNAQGVAEINHLLGFRVTRSNLASYITFIGHLYSRTPFYFFESLSEISSLLGGASHADTEAIRKTVLSIFPSTNGDQLTIEIEEKKHALLGKYFLLRLPCLYEGALFITRVRVSEGGIVNMDNDDALNIQGIFDEEGTFQYYVLDGTPEIGAKHAESVRRLGVGTKLLGWLLLGDTVVQWLFLPLFLFTCFVILSLGYENPATIAYLTELKKSTTITLIALLLGLVGTIVSAFRFVFIEFVIYVRKYTPSVWAQLADQIDTQQRSAASKMGVTLFTLTNAVEFSIRTIMVLSLLIYGLSNPPVLLLQNQGVHFGTAIASVLQSAPGVGDLFASAAKGSTYSIDTFSEPARKALSALTSFMLSTICLGLIGRLTKQAMSKT